MRRPLDFLIYWLPDNARVHNANMIPLRKGVHLSRYVTWACHQNRNSKLRESVFIRTASRRQPGSCMTLRTQSGFSPACRRLIIVALFQKALLTDRQRTSTLCCTKSCVYGDHVKEWVVCDSPGLLWRRWWRELPLNLKHSLIKRCSWMYHIFNAHLYCEHHKVFSSAPTHKLSFLKVSFLWSFGVD